MAQGSTPAGKAARALERSVAHRHAPGVGPSKEGSTRGRLPETPSSGESLQTSLENEPPLRAEVEVACVACNGAARRIVRTRNEIQEELRLLTRFHRRRIVRSESRALQERADFTHDYATRLVECITCKLLYRSPRPHSGDVLSAYTQETYAPERLEQIRRAQLRSFRGKARGLARRLRPGAKVLEVGSFVGSFLEAARQVGLDASGLDPSEQLAGHCHALGLRVERATVEDYARTWNARFDAICIWNTFDQLPHPGPTLDAASALLTPGGSLVLRVPNGAYYRAWSTRRRHRAPDDFGFAAAAWNNLIGFPYLSGHSLGSLDHLLGRHGFRRRALGGDTLCTLADRDYARWARVEEHLWKSAQRLHALIRPESAPWLEARYTRIEPGRDDASPTPALRRADMPQPDQARSRISVEPSCAAQCALQ